MVNVLSYSIFAYNESHYRIEGHNSYRSIRADVEGICILYIYVALAPIAVWIWNIEVRNDRLATESASGKLLIVQNHTTGLIKIYSLLQPPLRADIIFEELIF
jgi:hypothetical protein